MQNHIVIPPQSPSAIPIVAPSDATVNSSTTSTINKPPSKPVSKGNTNAKRLCRNVIIHGFCKFEGKGCEFNHEANKPSPPQERAEINGKVRLPRTGSGVFSSMSAESINAPVFVPKSTPITVSAATTAPSSMTASPLANNATNNGNSNTTTTTTAATTAAAASTAAIPNGTTGTSISMQQSDMHESKSRITSADSQSFGYTQDMSNMTNSFSNFGLSNDGSTSPEQAQSPTQMMATMGMMQADPYYYMNAPVFARQPLQYHLYASNAPPVSRLLPHHRTIQSFFMPDNLREELTQRNETTLMSAPAHDLGLPQEVHVYHSLYPLQHSQMAMPGEVSSFFGHPTSVYKAVSGADGRTYVLYRIEGFRLSKERAMSFVEQWRKVQHCNIISIHEAFTTRAFGDASLVFVYDYFPCARTLHDVYMTPHGQMTLQGELRTKKTGKTIVSEETIWSYVVQIVSAIKTAHAAGLAIRSIDPSKILVTSKHRIRVNCVASLDVMDYETKGSVCSAENREQDFVALGKLILALACGSPMAHQHLPECIESISQDYSEDLKDVILYLITSEEEEGDKDVDELVAMIAPHVLDEIDRSQSYNDSFENELSRELENGRLVRLLIKMGFINERPEFDMDPSWSETGDRYIIKLFRDYVFHQVDENGTPVIDMVHVLTCLNKLDAGLDEKMMLMSRDEQSCLIVSYKEVKNCIIAAFKDLTSGRK